MKRIIILVNLFILTIVSCSKEDSPQEPVILSDQNLITSFSLQINNETISGNIDQINKTINFDVVGANLNSLVPSVKYSAEAQLIPSENEPQDFSNDVIYNVIAENGDSNSYIITVNNRPLSSENKILSFSVVINDETVDATIDHDSQLITFNAGVFDITALDPTITVSEYSTISPATNNIQNFEGIINYTVTAENGNIAEYKVLVNPPTFEISGGVSTIGGRFTNYPVLLYTNANLRLFGNFLQYDRPNTTLYLFDGTNKYQLPLLSDSIRSEYELIIEYNLYTKIPSTVPNNANYKLIYDVEGIQIEAPTLIDITSLNAPVPISLNQETYERNDILIITGENLTDMIAIPSNGSVFLIENSNNYDYSVNNERTEARLTLDYYYLFPSYFARDPEEKTITLLGPDRRAGDTIHAIFK